MNLRICSLSVYFIRIVNCNTLEETEIPLQRQPLKNKSIVLQRIPSK